MITRDVVHVTLPCLEEGYPGYSRGMNEMTRKAKLWSYGVAYVSLGVGAGVSVAGNIADTHRIAADSGRTPDGLDIFIAGFWPAAVLLVIEMFVSRLWPRTLGAQLIRWSASLVFGFIAAFMSWIHLSDLLLSRAQPGTVATLGPLAIDGLAIMATALILAARSVRPAAGPVSDKPKRWVVGPDGESVVPADAPDESAPVPAVQPDGTWTQDSEATTPVDMSSESIWKRLDNELGASEPDLPVPVSPAPAGRVRVDNIPTEAHILINAWLTTPDSERPSGADVDKIIAGSLGRHPRTVRGWRKALEGALS